MKTTPAPITGRPTGGRTDRVTATIDDTVVLGPWVEARLAPFIEGPRIEEHIHVHLHFGRSPATRRSS